MRKKLKIAVMLAAELPIPFPKDYKKIYAPVQIALDTANGLAKKGHKIFFFTPKNSKSKNFKICEANFEPLYKNKILKIPGLKIAEKEKITCLFDQYLISLIYKTHLKEKFDIIHIHPIDRALPFGYMFPKTPVVYTLHDPVFQWREELYRLYKTKNQYLVSISKAQQKPAPDLNWGGTVYNGIDLKLFTFNKKPKDYLFFSGRIVPKKGAYEAIKIARAANKRLIIAGNPSKTYWDYWKNKIEPSFSNKIKYVGFVPYKKLVKYYAEAKATLMPILWEEPFGLIMTESMACGTPVIAFNRGSVPEIIKDGKTGFVVKNIGEAVAAIKKIDQIDRKECRKHVEENFSIKKMVDEYEKVYYDILRKKR